MATSLPPLPPAYKPIQHYLKTASEHDNRDVVVAYYCRLYALQKGMEIDKKGHDSKVWLSSMIDFLETVKTKYPDNEAIHNEVVGQVHMENYALQIFLYADNEDRAGRFGKNVVKSFYTAGMLIDVMTTFGEINEDLEKNKKYAKWKAAYIHKCLKNGETPIAGPLPDDGEQEEDQGATAGGASGGYPAAGYPPVGYAPAGYAPAGYAPAGQNPAGLNPVQPGPSQSLPPPGAHAPPTTPSDMSKPTPAPTQQWQAPTNPGGVTMGPEQYQAAMKFCKYAGSALQYEDSKTAIDNLTKALNILTTAHH